MKHQLLITLAAFALAGTANAQTPTPQDVEAIGNNLGPAVNALASGLGNTAETLLTTQSAVQTSAALGTTVVNTGTALVQGTSQAFTLPLALNVNNGALQQLGNPLFTAIDDPTAANLQNALDPNDLTTIANNLQPALVAVVNGDYIDPQFQPNGTGGKQFLINLLQGKIYTGIINQGAAYNGLTSVLAPVSTLVQGTQPGNALNTALAIDTFAILIAGAPVLEQIQPVAKQLADAGAPLTGPLADAIANVDTSGL